MIVSKPLDDTPSACFGMPGGACTNVLAYLVEIAFRTVVRISISLEVIKGQLDTAHSGFFDLGFFVELTIDKAMLILMGIQSLLYAIEVAWALSMRHGFQPLGPQGVPALALHHPHHSASPEHTSIKLADVLLVRVPGPA